LYQEARAKLGDEPSEVMSWLLRSLDEENDEQAGYGIIYCSLFTSFVSSS
jgi:hypothetical protein